MTRAILAITDGILAESGLSRSDLYGWTARPEVIGARVRIVVALKRELGIGDRKIALALGWDKTTARNLRLRNRLSSFDETVLATFQAMASAGDTPTASAVAMVGGLTRGRTFESARVLVSLSIQKLVRAGRIKSGLKRGRPFGSQTKRAA